MTDDQVKGRKEKVMFREAYKNRKRTVRSHKAERVFLAPMVHWSVVIALVSAVMYFSK